MIDFACKKFNLNGAIMCSLSLKKTEFDILILLSIVMASPVAWFW